MNKHTLRGQILLNVGTLLAVAVMLFAYNAWAAPSPMDMMPSQALGAPASHAVPGAISYQGTLTDASGKPITGNVNITFRLYAVPTGGAALWTEARTGANAVPVSNGLFNVLLGSLTPIPASVWNNANVYLGVQVAGDTEMTPREVINMVPFAMSVADGSINTDKLANFSVTGAKIADRSISRNHLASDFIISINSTHQMVRDEQTAIPAFPGHARVGNSIIVLSQPGKIYANCDVSIKPDPNPKAYVGLRIIAQDGVSIAGMNDNVYHGTSATMYTTISTSGILSLPAGNWAIRCELHRAGEPGDPIIHTYSITAFQVE